MAPSRLRVYNGPEETVLTAESRISIPLRDTVPLQDTVTLPLGDVLPLLTDAVENRRQWVGDFYDDDITISSDLYEVLLAYQHFRRPSAKGFPTWQSPATPLGNPFGVQVSHWLLLPGVRCATPG